MWIRRGKTGTGASGGEAEAGRDKKLLESVRHLRQSAEAWQCAVRLARWWIVPRGAPAYRPHLLLVVAAESGLVVRSHLHDDQSTPPAAGKVLEELLQAMRRPVHGAGSARRPAAVYLEDPDLAAAITPWLGEASVRCELRRSLPTLVEALRAAERRMDPREPLPGLLTIPGVTVPIVAHLYELAADYYRSAPWDYLTDREPFEIRYPPDGPARLAVVMGSGREVFGLGVYDSLEVMRLVLANPEAADSTLPSTLALILDNPTLMSFEDLDDMVKYGWALAAEHAYPTFTRAGHGHEMIPPSTSDLFWLEGTLPAILAYVHHQMRFRRSRGHLEIRPAELLLPVQTISGERQVYLRVPVR